MQSDCAGRVTTRRERSALDSAMAAAVRAELARHVAGQVRRSLALIPIAVIGVGLLLRGEVPGAALVYWVVVALIDVVRIMVANRFELVRAADRGPDRLYLLRVAPQYAAFGLVWGCLPVIAVTMGTERAVWLSVIVDLAVVSLMVGAAAAARAIFVVTVVALICPMAASVLLWPEGSAALVVVTAAYLVLAFLLHEAIHRLMVANTSATYRNGVLADQLAQFVADRDPLTGLYSRNGFLARLTAEAEEVGAGRLLAVAVANVAQLAAVNELFGGEAGDELLRTVAHRLDEAGGRVVAARLGGDEFALATFVASRGGVTALSDRFAGAVAEPLVVRSRILDVELHVATAVGSPARAGDLVVEAMAEVSRARARLRPTLHVALDPLDERRMLLDELSAGLADGSVQPWFQPIVDASTRALVGWEALARWRHPRRGTLTPDTFLPLMAMAGLNTGLLQAILRSSLVFSARVARISPDLGRVHVNLTPADLRRPDLVPTIAELVQEYSVAPDQLVFEVTEHDVLLVNEHLLENLRGLRQLGAHLAVDDFGTGYSSLSHLLELPVDHLKIDKRFVAQLPHDPAALTLVRGVVGLARGFGLATIAEGVESWEQADCVEQLGCTQLQGLLLGPALPVPDALALAAARSIPAARAEYEAG